MSALAGRKLAERGFAEIRGSMAMRIVKNYILIVANRA